VLSEVGWNTVVLIEISRGLQDPSLLGSALKMFVQFTDLLCCGRFH